MTAETAARIDSYAHIAAMASATPFRGIAAGGSSGAPDAALAAQVTTLKEDLDRRQVRGRLMPRPPAACCHDASPNANPNSLPGVLVVAHCHRLPTSGRRGSTEAVLSCSRGRSLVRVAPFPRMETWMGTAPNCGKFTAQS